MSILKKKYQSNVSQSLIWPFFGSHHEHGDLNNSSSRYGNGNYVYIYFTIKLHQIIRFIKQATESNPLINFTIYTVNGISFLYFEDDARLSIQYK